MLGGKGGRLDPAWAQDDQVETVMLRKTPWGQPCFVIGGKAFSLLKRRLVLVQSLALLGGGEVSKSVQEG